MPISYYSNLLSTKPEKQISPEILYNLIQSGKYKKTIVKLRSEKDKTRYDLIKKRELPAIAISGTFSKRANDSLIKHSGLIQIDIDEENVKSYRELFKRIKKDPYTFMCFRSPGGKGIKVIIKISDNPLEHLFHFYALEKYYFINLKVKIDPSCKDISRAMILSWDQYIFRNPDAKVFTQSHFPKVKSQVIPSKSKFILSNKRSDEETVNQIVSEIQKIQIDITGNYERWYKIAFALADALGENGRTYFHAISQYYRGYKEKETDLLFTNCLKKNNHKIHLGTLVYFAKEAGVWE